MLETILSINFNHNAFIYKYEKLYKYLQRFNETGIIVRNDYHNHLLKSSIIIVLHILFMKLMYKLFKMKNNTSDVSTMIELFSNVLVLYKIIRKIRGY